MAAEVSPHSCATPGQQPGWTLASVLLPSLKAVQPRQGDHQGGTPITIFGAGFAFNGTDASSMRCCWDHHGATSNSPSPRMIASPHAFPNRSVSLLSGGDGVMDVESAVEAVNDSHVICRSYASIPGYTHTDDLLLSFRPSCTAGALFHTRARFRFLIDERAMQLVSVVPRGGPVLGGTPVVIRGTGFGGRWMRCRFGFETVDATYVDRTTVHCVTPAVRAPETATLEVTPDGAEAAEDDAGTPSHWWTLPLNFTFYDVTTPRVSSVWPLGGPDAGGGIITIRGQGFIDYSGGVEGGGQGITRSGLGVRLGSGHHARWLRAQPLNSTTLLAWTVNITNASSIEGVPLRLDGSGFDDGGFGPASLRGEAIAVSLNGGQRAHADLLLGIDVTYRIYPAAGLRVSEVFPSGAHHVGGTEITLFGTGFADLGRVQCAFGAQRSQRERLPLDRATGSGNKPPLNLSEPMEIVTEATVLGPNEARCRSPRVPLHPATPTPIELLLNGDRATKSDDGIPFTFYGQPSAQVAFSAIFPQGAPIAGGTLLTVYGKGMLDLGDTRVRFGKHGATEAVVHEGGHNLTVLTPPVPRSGKAPITVSADGATFLRSKLSLVFFDASVISVSSVHPHGGPSSGGTHVLIRGAGLLSLPGACLFGGTAVRSTVLNETALRCHAPAWSSTTSTEQVSVRVNLNGEDDELRKARGQVQFYFYDASAVYVSSVAPQGGPSGGGTIVTVRGSGFEDLSLIHI